MKSQAEELVEKDTQSPETLAERVCRTLEDLGLIRQSLQLMNNQTTRSEERTLVLDLELAAELKTVVDTLRELLWSYIAALSAKSGRCPKEVLEWYRMELAVDMLRNKNVSDGDETVATEEHSTFQDLITSALTVTAMHTGRDQRA